MGGPGSTVDQAATPEEAAAGLLGQTVRAAGHGPDSLIDLRFGDRGPGTYHLRIHRCSWRIEHGADLLAGDGDIAERIAAAVARLNGTTVTAITLARPSLSTTFEFGDSRLLTFGIHTDPVADDAEQWQLSRPDGLVLSVGPGATWRLSPRA